MKMGGNDSVKKGLTVPEGTCADIRMKLETAAELDEAGIAHLQSCRECSAFFQRIEDELTRAASEKIFRLNRVELAGSFARRRGAACESRKRSFILLHASGFAMILAFFAAFMWLVSSALHNVKNSDYVDLERSDEIQKRTLVSYSLYVERLNNHYDRIYGPYSVTDVQEESPAGDFESEADAQQLAEVYSEDIEDAGGEVFPAELESGLLAKNIGGEIGEFYSENIRYLSEDNGLAQ